MRSISTITAVAAVLLIGGTSIASAQQQPAPRAKPSAKPSVTKPAAPAAAAPSGKSVCVASTLGHQFAEQKIGLMVFGNALEHAAIDSWGVDEAAVRRIGQIAGRGYTVRRIAVPTALATVNSAPFSGWTSNPAQDRIRAIAAASPKCDVYVTLMPSGTNYNGTNQYLSGLGIVDTSAIVDRTFVFASFSVVVYEGNTFAILKSERPGATIFPGLMAAPSAMHKQVDRSWIPATAQATAQSAQLKNTTRALVEEGLSKALPDVFGGGA